MSSPTINSNSTPNTNTTPVYLNVPRDSQIDYAWGDGEKPYTQDFNFRTGAAGPVMMVKTPESKTDETESN